jgi:hypothetical protein
LPGVNGEVNHTDYTRSWSNPYPSGGYDYTLCEDACQKSGLQFSKEIDYREASFIFSTVGDIAEGFCSKLNRTSLGFDTCTVEVPATCEKLVVE